MRGLLLALALAAGPAAAHDSWFVPLPPTDRGEALFALGSGNRFPRLELPVSPRQIASGGCRGDGVAERSLRRAGERPDALLLRTPRPVPGGVGLSCWVQWVPIEIEIDDATVAVYLDEVRAPPAVRERWAALKARGVRWQETYVKHARIETAGPGVAAHSAQAVEGLGLDARLETAERPLRAGQRLSFQVLRDGRPLAGLPVELVGDAAPAGIWRTTDADGRIEAALPQAGRWILRGTDLRPAADDRWDSRFLTLAFEVQR
ncbi:MAG: hypothetical protein Fur0014_05870 [Rubrivivax sp.]